MASVCPNQLRFLLLAMPHSPCHPQVSTHGVTGEAEGKLVKDKMSCKALFTYYYFILLYLFIQPAVGKVIPWRQMPFSTD